MLASQIGGLEKREVPYCGDGQTMGRKTKEKWRRRIVSKVTKVKGMVIKKMTKNLSLRLNFSRLRWARCQAIVDEMTANIDGCWQNLDYEGKEVVPRVKQAWYVIWEGKDYRAVMETRKVLKREEEIETKPNIFFWEEVWMSEI